MKYWPVLSFVAIAMAGCGNSSPSNTATTPPATDSSAAATTPAGTAQSAPSYEQLLTDVEQRLKDKKVNEAVQLLTQAIQTQPQRLEAYVRRATLLAENKLLQEAVADLSSALKIDPHNAKLLNTRGYYFLLGQNLDRAAEDFGDAIGLDLSYAQPYNNRGLVRVAQKRFDDAIKDFDNALRSKSDYVDAHNNRGFALMQAGQDQEAVLAFSRALEIDSKYVNALANRGRCYLKLKQPQEAAADFTAALAIQPDTISHVTNRAEAWKDAGDIAAANADLAFVVWLKRLNEINNLLVRNTRDADAWAERGRHLLAQKRMTEARRSLDNALAVQSTHPVALAGRAQLLLVEQKFAEAVEECTKAINVDRRFENFAMRGDAYFALGDFAKAIDDYQAARRFDQQMIEAYLQHARKLRETGDEQLAQQEEQRADLLKKQLTESFVETKSAAPRAMVIEQVKYEETAAGDSAVEKK